MTTQMVDKSNFDNKQYKADLQSAYDCGYVAGQVDILEKLKAEINSEDVNCRYDEYAYSSGLQKTIELIDKHIAEIKGEMEKPNELDEYLREVIKNDEKCKNCMLKHEDNVCFFAYECIKNNHYHFKLEWKCDEESKE